MIRNILPYGGGNDVVPRFNNEQEHNAYWTKRILEQGKAKYPEFYSRYVKYMMSGNQAKASAMLSAMGSIPMFKVNNPTQPAMSTRVVTKGPQEINAIEMQRENDRAAVLGRRDPFVNEMDRYYTNQTLQETFSTPKRRRIKQ